MLFDVVVVVEFNSVPRNECFAILNVGISTVSFSALSRNVKLEIEG